MASQHLVSKKSADGPQVSATALFVRALGMALMVFVPGSWGLESPRSSWVSEASCFLPSLTTTPLAGTGPKRGDVCLARGRQDR